MKTCNRCDGSAWYLMYYSDNPEADPIRIKSSRGKNGSYRSMEKSIKVNSITSNIHKHLNNLVESFVTILNSH